MNRRRSRGAIVIAALAAAIVIALAGPGDAQRSRIDLVAQTTFVTEDPVTFDLRIPGSLTDRQLGVRVYEPVDDHTELTQLWENAPVEGAISDFTITDLSEIVVSADIVSIELPDDEIGLILRREPGALPVVFDLLDNGFLVDRLVTAVVVDNGVGTASIDFAFVADGRAPFAHRENGELEIDPPTVTATLTDALLDAPARALVTFTPETLTALADDRTEGGLVAIDTIRETLDDHLVPLAPWVTIDEEAWRLAGETDRVFAQYAVGQTTVETFLGFTPSPIVRFDADTNAETLQLLRGVGVTAGVIEPAQVEPFALEQAAGRPLEVRDVNDVAMPVVPIDRTFLSTLEGNDPELVAQQRFTELVVRARSVGTDRAIVLDLAELDPVTWTLLLDLIDQTDRIGFTDVAEILDRPAARDAAGAVLRVDLLADEPGDVEGAASVLRLTESVLGSYTEMVAPLEAPVAQLRTVLQASMSDSLDTAEREAYTDAVFDLVLPDGDDFTVIEPDRITLAARSATLPLAIQNDQPLPINAIVRTTSEKLRFPDGEDRLLVLQPGLNELEVPVETVASGDARIQITVTSPDGRLELARGAIDVRSTAISGIGLIVSLVSLTVLGTWWARTILRVRRTRRAASVPDDPSEGEGPDTTDHDAPDPAHEEGTPS